MIFSAQPVTDNWFMNVPGPESFICKLKNATRMYEPNLHIRSLLLLDKEMHYKSMPMQSNL